MNPTIIEASELPLHDKVYLKRDVFGWRIVHPIKNPDGSLNLWNFLFGGVRNFVVLIVILFVLSMLFYGTHEMTKSMKDIVSNPCGHCSANVYPVSEREIPPVNSIPDLGG